MKIKRAFESAIKSDESQIVFCLTNVKEIS